MQSQDLRKTSPAALLRLAVLKYCLRRSALLGQFCANPENNSIDFAPLSKQIRILDQAKSPTTYQHGLAFIELMIATALSMFILLAITGLIISAKAAQSSQSDAANIQDTARFVLDNLSRSVRQAGYVNWDNDDAPMINAENISPSIIGMDAGSFDLAQYVTDFTITKSSKTLSNSSDVLVLRFFGSGRPADDTVLNCAGFGVPAPTSHDDPERGRDWSIYYVAQDVNNEPALFCQYRGNSKSESNSTLESSSEFKTEAIAKGVESFQVLYGLQTDDSVTEKKIFKRTANNCARCRYSCIRTQQKYTLEKSECR